MHTTVRSVRSTIGRARRLLTLSALAGRLSLALSAALLLGSSLSAIATGNTAPHFTNVSVDKPVVKEGETFTLSGAFTDPDPGNHFNVHIHWGDATSDTLHLPVGQKTFSATHVYTDNKYIHDIESIQVSVWDYQDGESVFGNDSVDVPIYPQNVPPAIGKAIKVTKAGGKSGAVVVEGTYTDAGQDTMMVTATWGDVMLGPGSPKVITPCTSDQFTHTFRCEHTYPTSPAKTYQITVRMVDDDGGEDTATKSVQIP